MTAEEFLRDRDMIYVKNYGSLYASQERIIEWMEQYAREYARSIQMEDEDMREWEKLYKEKVNPMCEDDFYEGMECYKQQILNKL